MTFDDLKKSSHRFRPALWLDDFMSAPARSLARLVILVVAVVSLLLGLDLFGSVPQLSALSGFAGLAISVFYFALAALILASSIEFYYNSIYYGRTEDGMTYELARIINGTDADLTLGFFVSGFGSFVLKRLGVSDDAFGEFLAKRPSVLGPSGFSIEGPLSPVSYLTAIYRQDAALKDFFFKSGILEADLAGASGWLEGDVVSEKDRMQWWSRKNLAKIPGLGKSFSYGQAWLIERYGARFGQVHDISRIDTSASYHKAEVEELENALSRASEANAILVSEETSGGIDVVGRLAKLIEEGRAHPSIEHKQVFQLDTDALIAAGGTKNGFEIELMKVMKQAIHSGNIVLVIPNITEFIASARSLGSDVVSILDPYLSSAYVQVIALCDTMNFHQAIEPNGLLMERFEKITVKGGTDEETMRLLEDKVEGFEAESGLFFTYQALGAIAESADRYIVEGVMPDKAVDLLIEAIPSMKSRNITYVGRQDILDMVERKTGIPVAGVKEGEKGKLADLERILHERIVGQNEAVEAISTAMRRARSGIGNPNRPMGSFLFIGPTGVGKTETTKALAQVFFGDEDKITRLDMSEYSGDDALTRLIGSFETGKAGTLTTMLRENPYGVLLLDEFEKANREVHNLFLQVLDEGIFSDMVGKKVNARNLIIIATSNAGSDTIWRLSQEGKDLMESKDAIVDDIIQKGIFKPEFMNRFDGVILYHPLTESDLKTVATLMLRRLKKRLEAKKINLAITDDLVNFLVAEGSDPKFGARPINRAIQEKVEAVIAKKIIAGSIPPGAEVTLTAADLSGEPQSEPTR